MKTKTIYFQKQDKTLRLMNVKVQDMTIPGLSQCRQTLKLNIK
jgi:hypothetical protein